MTLLTSALEEVFRLFWVPLQAPLAEFVSAAESRAAFRDSGVAGPLVQRDGANGVRGESSLPVLIGDPDSRGCTLSGRPFPS